MNNWIVQTYFSIGLDHKARQLPCQDALRYVNTPNLVLAVAADGVGSLSNSHIAANAAAEATVSWFQKMAQTPINPDIAAANIRNQLIPSLQENNLSKAKNYGVLPDTMDCNLAFAAILPDADFAIWGILGDGAVCLFSRDHNVVLSAADSVSANGTETIMQSDAAERIQLCHCPLSGGQLLGFMVMTDGLEDEIYRKNSIFMRKRAEDYFNAMLAPSESERRSAVEALMAELPSDFDDDRSLAIISNAGRSKPVTLAPDPTWLCNCGNRNPLDTAVCGVCQQRFQELYRSVDFGSSIEAYFYSLNANPARERQLLNLPPQPRETPIKTPQPKPSPRNAARNNTPRYSQGQMMGNQNETGSQGNPDGATKRTTNMKQNTNPVSGEKNGKKKSGPNLRNITTNDDGSFKDKSTVKEETKQGKNAAEGSVTISINLKIVSAIVAAVCFVLMLIAVGFAHLRISRLEAQVDTLIQTQYMEHAVQNTYRVVTAGYLWELDDGMRTTRIARLAQDTEVVRLNESIQSIDDVSYIYVRTSDDLEGWYNLALLTSVDASSAQDSQTGE